MSENDFIYESGINRMKEINTNIKTLGDRTTWLVGFLIAVVAALAASIFSEGQAIQTENPITTLFIIYSLIIFFMIAGIIIPSYGIIAYSEPQNLMKEKSVTKKIKNLQIRTEQNMKYFDKLNFRLKLSVVVLFLSLAYVAVKLF